MFLKNRLWTLVPVLGFVLIWFAGCARSDVCDLCNCRKVVADDGSVSIRIDECWNGESRGPAAMEEADRRMNITVELDNVQWPTVANVPISARFDQLRLSYLPKVLCSPSTMLKEINLDDNAIESITADPFQFCRQLVTVSVANNSLHRLSKDFLKAPIALETLNLSYNFLSEFDNELLVNQRVLRTIDLSHNQLTELQLIDILRASPNLASINAENNQIFVIHSLEDVDQPSLTHLNLAANELTVITRTSFWSFKNLEHLNVSGNSVTNIEQDAFVRLAGLKVLDLSHNELEDPISLLPPSVEHLRLASNKFRYWPIGRIPANLSILEVQANQLTELLSPPLVNDPSGATVETVNIVVLNASHNNIAVFPGRVQLPQLLVLDLSYNNLVEIPANLGRQAPLLDWILLNGNPIKMIQFTQPMSFRRLEMRALPLLQEVNASEFRNDVATEQCIELAISHCPLLTRVIGSFTSLGNLCALDLSHNAITQFDEGLVTWTSLTKGIDLQGNPLHCDCPSQWMLDKLLPQIYAEKSQQHLLVELRCAGPDPFSGHRFVRYLNQGKAFCKPSEALKTAEKNQIKRAYFGLIDNVTPNEVVELKLSEGPGLFIGIGMLVVVMLLVVLVTVVLVRDRQQRTRKRNNRRFEQNGYL